MKKLVYVAVIGCALLACKEHRSSGGSTSGAAAPAAAPRANKPEVVVTAQQLVADYQANEISADAKYKDKRVGVAGRIGSISKDVMGSPFITIGGGGEMEVVQAQCAFADEAMGELATLTKGQAIGVVCTCDGLLMNVQLKDCVINHHK